MAQGQFLIRNRHNNRWYGRVVIPSSLRDHFNGKCEFRRTLNTTDKTTAKRRALEFWVECQKGFEALSQSPTVDAVAHISDRMTGLSMKKKDRRQAGFLTEHHRIEFEDVFGSRHVVDLDDPAKEQEVALQLQANATALLDKYKDRPDILDRLLSIQSSTPAPQIPVPTNLPESPTPFSEAVDLYINKLTTQGRKGKKLSTRTLLNYQGRLGFWKEVLNTQPVHDITLKQLSEIQNWLTRLPSNYSKRGMTTAQAVRLAQSSDNSYESISDKTRAEYLGQLKGVLEYAHACGFVTADLSRHVEIPNTKQSKSVERLPFTADDMAKIFPENYDQVLGRKNTALDWNARYWFPLIAAYSGARLEEIGQLNTDDIKTCPDTGIVYMNVTDSGLVGDGEKKHAKNKNSVRPIPVHSKLLELGFMDYVETRKSDTKDKRLFKLKRDKQGRLGKGLSNWFSRFETRPNGSKILGYIERQGVISKGTYDTGEKWTKTFHSFRHTAIDNLRGKQFENGEYIREQDIGLVMGHEKGKLETANYGADRSQLKLRKAVIETISYTRISLKT